MLPLLAAIAKKIELLLSSFLYSGKPERLRLKELYNKPAKGGLGLLDIRKKADSLLLKQLNRMLLKNKKPKKRLLLDQEGAYQHLSYWLGAQLRQYLPALMERSSVLHTAPPPYHKYALHLLLDGFQIGLKPAELRQATYRLIYSKYTSHTIPEPKITTTFLQVNFQADIWPDCPKLH